MIICRTLAQLNNFLKHSPIGEELPLSLRRSAPHQEEHYEILGQINSSLYCGGMSHNSLDLNTDAGKQAVLSITNLSRTQSAQNEVKDINRALLTGLYAVWRNFNLCFAKPTTPAKHMSSERNLTIKNAAILNW